MGVGEACKGPLGPLYADVVVPLALPPLTFLVGETIADTLVVGDAVVVQLGPRKIYMGIVWKIHAERPDFKTIKSIDRVLEGTMPLSEHQIRLWEWVSSYYMCTLGDVMRAALPASLKPEGFSHEEFVSDTFRPKPVQILGLGAAAGDTAALNLCFEKLKRAPLQYQTLIDITEKLTSEELFSGSIARRQINADTTILNTLAKKGIITIKSVEPSEGSLPELSSLLPILTEIQEVAHLSIKEQFASKSVVLLHGVTGSGKTEIYINLIAETLSRGEDALYLLPEIALTTQLIERMRIYFGDRVVVYHSKFSDRKRAEIYRHLAHGCGGELIVGVRSSIFLPIRKLGLVVVDEEHENSFKQSESAPRYHARDCAIVLAGMFGVGTLLGSATPSIESYVNATSDKYGLVTLVERYGGASLPHIMVSDSLRAAKRGEKSSHFNKVLLDKIKGALASDEQVMLFQNRRGFSPYIECPECGWVAGCPHCNVTLTLHKAEGALKCHYCGYKSAVIAICPSCKKGDLQNKGFGTEKVEEELGKLLPDARIARLDRDTTATERGFNSIISDFATHKTDILVGTQMITKGFDFSEVSLVGILNADNMLNFPDFRASERAFQLMTQVAGRAGRRRVRGEVVVQTSQPTHPVIGQIVEGDYQAMVRTQLAERESFFYPPYCRIIAITLKFHDKSVLWRSVTCFDQLSRPVFGRRLLGPEAPSVDRVKGEYLMGFMVKIERDKSFARAKEFLASIIKQVNAQADFRNVSIICNVDPQ